MKARSTNIIMRNKDVASVFVVTTTILMVPMVAMQFTNEVKWELPDFIIMGTLLASSGLLVVLASRRIENLTHRVAVMLALLAILIMIWAELSVGVFGTPLAGS